MTVARIGTSGFAAFWFTGLGCGTWFMVMTKP
jgi:hypothetical protein